MEKTITPSENTPKLKNDSELSTSSFEEDLKKIDSGFTFFSYILSNTVYIIGNIKDYLTKVRK